MAFYMDTVHDIPAPATGSFGDAWNWGKLDSEGGQSNKTSLKELGYAVSSTPRVGDIAWWDKNAGKGAAGHVGIVIAIEDGSIIVASDNYQEPLGFDDVSRVPLGGGGPTGFIHVAPGDPPPEEDNAPPTAGAGGPYDVNEGSTVALNGSGTDPDGDPLTYSWSPGTRLSNPNASNPTFSAGDIGSFGYTLTVSDGEDSASDQTTVTVHNVAPSVSVSSTSGVEGSTVSVDATYTDPGPDTHTATIDWGDGTSSSPTAANGQISGAHTYGDNGTYTVTVAATDDDGGVGSDSANATIGNLNPNVSLDLGEEVVFPGGAYSVARAGEPSPASATANDPGSDDLQFSWSSGRSATYYNNGTSPDPTMSPGGTFPFHAEDTAAIRIDEPGVAAVAVDSTDDDGGSTSATDERLILGNENRIKDRGDWYRRFTEAQLTQSFWFVPRASSTDIRTLDGYLDLTRAMSEIFGDSTHLNTRLDALRAMASASPSMARQAESELLVAWLNVATGSLDLDRQVRVGRHSHSVLAELTRIEGLIRNGGLFQAIDAFRAAEDLNDLRSDRSFSRRQVVPNPNEEPSRDGGPRSTRSVRYAGWEAERSASSWGRAWARAQR